MPEAHNPPEHRRRPESAQGLQRVLGFGPYETAWAWQHKPHRAMVRPDRDRLEGVVEVDETMVGGVDKGAPGGYGDKTAVMVAFERAGTGKLGRVRLASPTAPAPRTSSGSPEQ